MKNSLPYFMPSFRVFSVARRTATKPTNKMTIANATKKLEKAGFKVEKLEYGFHASNPSFPRVIEFHRNGRSDEITCINVRRLSDNHDSMTDYCAGSFADNISQAIRKAAN